MVDFVSWSFFFQEWFLFIVEFYLHEFSPWHLELCGGLEPLWQLIWPSFHGICGGFLLIFLDCFKLCVGWFKLIRAFPCLIWAPWWQVWANSSCMVIGSNYFELRGYWFELNWTFQWLVWADLIFVVAGFNYFKLHGGWIELNWTFPWLVWANLNFVVAGFNYFELIWTSWWLFHGWLEHLKFLQLLGTPFKP
jgi:hypothetical protein